MDLNLLNTLFQGGTFLSAIIGVIIGLTQLRSANRDAHKSRMAEMSWQIYQAYSDPRIRQSRGAAEIISASASTNPGFNYGKDFADKGINPKNLDEETLDTAMRRLLRFYNQVGVLVEKKLVDDDFVFGLVGAGLESSWMGVNAAIEFYEKNTNIQKEITQLKKSRPIHPYVRPLHESYKKWKEVMSLRP